MSEQRSEPRKQTQQASHPTMATNTTTQATKLETELAESSSRAVEVEKDQALENMVEQIWQLQSTQIEAIFDGLNWSVCNIIPQKADFRIENIDIYGSAKLTMTKEIEYSPAP
ncbi:valine--tRNA ligase [Striga asiatica]|uniref:Valine--tRNA ligase n=1 Tax=Striga asiatica TaxID=4170 RepID=A0A5A7QT24_STRAF|nr:valine--tRNA ligase [Striga asiatica]